MRCNYEPWLWCVAASMALLLEGVRAGGGHFSNDSFQYMSVAENLVDRGDPSTSIVYYDTERMAGTVPAPSTTFPPGYPILIAATSLLGLRIETAALVVSAASFLVLPPLVLFIARLLGLDRPCSRLVLVALLGNGWAAHYALRVGAESLFTVAQVAALACFMVHERAPAASSQSKRALWVGSALVGLAYWVRYAGLFLFCALVLFYGTKLLIRRDRTAARSCAALGAPALMIAALMVRNVVITGTWKGGNTKDVHHAVVPVLKHLVTSVAHSMAGVVRPQEETLPSVLVVFALAFALVAAITFRGARRWRSDIPACETRADAGAASTRWLLWLYVAVYTAGMVHLGIRSVITFGTRMLHPLLPLLLLGIAEAVSRVARSPRTLPAVVRAGAAASCIVPIAIGLTRASGASVTRTHAVTEAALSQSLPDGRPLRDWLAAHLAPDSVVVATDAQATGYLLKRPTVSLVESEYSAEVWDERRVHELMRTYDADFVVLYPRADASQVPVQRESAFLDRVLRGQLPDWLEVVADNGSVTVLHRLDGGRTAGLRTGVR